MNNPLDRKMFRQAGMSKQPIGILASSPELMTAAKGYNRGGAVGSSGDLNRIYDPNAITSYMNQGNLIPGTGRNTPFGGYINPNPYKTPAQIKREEVKFRENQGTQIEGPGIIPVGKTEAKTFKVEPQIIDDFKSYKKGDKFKLEDPIIENEVVKKETTENKDKINETNEKLNLIKPDKTFSPEVSTLDITAEKNKKKPPSKLKQVDQSNEELKIAVSESALFKHTTECC